MTEKKNWNKYFAELKAERDTERARKLAEAKAAAANTDKEPFDRERFRALYMRLNPDDVDKHTPWETLFRESEYDYYVSQPGKKTLKEYIEHLVWLEGFG